MRRSEKNNRSLRETAPSALLAVLVIAAVYGALAWALSPLEFFWSGDAGVKLWQMEAWIDNEWRTPWASYAQSNLALDPGHEWAPLGPPFAMWDGDRVLTIYTLPYVLGSSVLLAIGGTQALLLPPLLAGVAGLAIAAWRGFRFPARVVLLTVLVLGLATPWLFYSITFWGHTLASVLVWVALALALHGHETRGWVPGLVAGLLLGSAIGIRPEALTCAVAAVIILLGWRRTRRTTLWVVVGLGAALLAGVFYQRWFVPEGILGQVSMNFAPTAFDSPLWSMRRLFEVSQMVIESRHMGVLAVSTGGALALCLAFVYRRLRRGHSPLLAQAVEVAGLFLVVVGVLVLLARGHEPIDLLMGAPVVWLLLAQPSRTPASTAWRRGRAGQLMAWCGLVILLSVAVGRQNGGLQWGPRYLMPILGPLVLLSIAKWDWLDRDAGPGLGRWGLRVSFAGLVLAGVVTQAAGVVRLSETRAANGALTRALLAEPSAVVVTDMWFVAQIAPSVYGRVPLLLVRTAEEWEELDRRLEAQGVERVRLVRLPGRETALSSGVAASWCAVEGSVEEVATIPRLSVTDFVPRAED
jgi:hypothetical protein